MGRNKKTKKKKNNKKYFKYLDIIRLFSCISIFLYHLGILKGGYLAVCIFFVLSGYLSCVSAFNDGKFSLKKYYTKRIKKLYVPLFFVVFITILITSFLPNIGWFNLKPETNSVLFGYNNFWQLGANMDYFASHNNSPFMHLWYISILMQFDLVFPILYGILKKIGDKTNKIIPCIITCLISIISGFYFVKASVSANMMITYYSTFTRVFSLFFGLTLGFIHNYYGPVLTDRMKEKDFSKLGIYFYLLVLAGLFIFTDSKSLYFSSIMILVTLITCRLIDYSVPNEQIILSKKDKIVKSLSEVSYEIYLIQYPVIFFLQNVAINTIIKTVLIVVITILLSYVIHFATNIKNKKYKGLRYFVLIVISAASLFGVYQYIVTEDHTAEMEELEKQLSENAKKMEQNQEDYNTLVKEEQEKWDKVLDNLEAGENQIKDIVSNLPVVAIGDSVMLGAIDNLHATFPNSYVDAKVSRSLWKASGILEELINKNALGEPIVINLGANGDCSLGCKKEIMELCKGKEVFWLNTTNNQEFNKNLLSFSSKYSNLHVIDWNKLSRGHEEYFYADGIHLTGSGRKAYTQVVYSAIYQTYLAEYNVKKAEIIKKHEEELKNKITFYGNSVLLNAYDYIHTNFSEAQFVINKDFNFEMIKNELMKAIEEKSLSYNVVFAFDNSINLSTTDYQELIKLCENHKIYIVAINSDLSNLVNNSDNVTILDFYSEVKNNEDYLLSDKKHLTDKGNQALNDFLKDKLM